MQRLKELGRIFLPGLGLKRWLAVVFMGLLQLAIGTALWLTGLARERKDNPLLQLVTFRFLPRAARGVAFVASGALLTYVGWRELSHNIMRVMMPEQSEGDLGKVLLQRQRAERGRRVVVIGADPGLSPVIQALQEAEENIRVDVILAATEHGYRVQDLQNRFGLSSSQIHFPSTDSSVLYAELEDGRLLEGATTINGFSGGRIKDLFLSRDIRRVKVWEAESGAAGGASKLRDYMPNVSEAALDAIRQAEMIVLTPGRIFTQVLPNLTLPRLAQAVLESESTKVFVTNLMTEPGHTDGWTVADHLEAIRELTGVTLDYAVTHQGEVSGSMLQQYRNEGAAPVQAKQEEVMGRLIFANTGEETNLVEGAVMIGADIVTEKPQIVTLQRGEDTILREMPVVRHDPAKLARIFDQLLAEGL